MKRRRSALLFCGVALAVVGALLAAPLLAQKKSSSAESDIRAVLDAQVAAWNRGDIEGFMAGYWKSEQTTFLSSGGVSRGWQALLDRYKRGYPDKKAMGTLAFTDLEITMLGKHAALIIGRWQIERESSAGLQAGTSRLGGVFTLVAKKFSQGWRIVSDHTSSLTPAK